MKSYGSWAVRYQTRTGCFEGGIRNTGEPKVSWVCAWCQCSVTVWRFGLIKNKEFNIVYSCQLTDQAKIFYFLFFFNYGLDGRCHLAHQSGDQKSMETSLCIGSSAYRLKGESILCWPFSKTKFPPMSASWCPVTLSQSTEETPKDVKFENLHKHI